MQPEKSIEATIQSRLTQLSPTFLEVVNESNNHSVPENSETHFKVTVVSADFDGKMLLARHRMVNELLTEELAGSVHALALHTYTDKEWLEKSGSSLKSPPCLGGSKA